MHYNNEAINGGLDWGHNQAAVEIEEGVSTIFEVIQHLIIKSHDYPTDNLLLLW